MTRGATPRFDLYEELEVSRQATPEVIEAAYRALVKRHHPDVATPEDRERITRLNVARDWLLSPTRRARYDGTAPVEGPRPRPRVRRERRPEEASAPRPARTSSPQSFGVNSREVRQFLGEVREIDGVRAASLLAAKSAVDAADYKAARTASLDASRASRGAEWGFARDAASVIVRGKLPDSPFAREVAGVVADVAGAIVVRDLLPSRDFLLLLEAWTKSKPALAGETIPVAPPPGRPRVAVPAELRAIARRRPVALGLLGAALALLVAVAAFGRGPAEPGAAVAGLTSQPSSGSVGVLGTPAPSPIVPGSPGASTGVLPPAAEASTGVPTFDPTPIGPRRTDPATATLRPAAEATPRPTSVPTRTPTATPAPTGLPTAGPTSSPSTVCTVIDLVGSNSSTAQAAWSSAGFTGTVVFSPQPPPQYKIGSQSLAAGTDVACSSGITVQARP